jgi:PAS domain S-box-containing protein
MKQEEIAMKIIQGRNSLLDSVQVGFILTDTHSTILYANRQAEVLFGFKRDRMKGRRIRTLFLPEDLTFFLPNILYLTLYQNGFVGEALLRQKDGTRIFVGISTASFKEEGEVLLAFSFQEIQRLKNLERQKTEMVRWASLGIMMEEIAHQIRNPIVSIGGYAKRILKSTPLSLPQESKSHFNRILLEAKKLETMIGRMEEYILLPKPAFQEVKIQEVVEQGLLAFSKESAEKSISIQLEEGTLGKRGLLFLDPEMVIKLISRVLENSMEAIQEVVGKKSNTIRVVIFDDEDRIGVSISDKGVGIPRKILPHIFDPFFSTRPGHHGLGLTFVKRVMEEHGGTLSVASRPKRGTAICLYFPKDRRRKVRRELISPDAMRPFSAKAKGFRGP